MAKQEEIKNVMSAPFTPQENEKDKEIVAKDAGDIKLSQEQIISLLATVDELKRKDAARDEEVAKLLYAADKARIEKYETGKAATNKLVPTCKVSLWDGKIIVGSRMMPQEVYVDNSGIYHELQMVEMYLDGVKDPVVIPYKEQFKKVVKVEAQIIKKSVDADGNNIVTVELKDGKKIDLDINFIN